MLFANKVLRRVFASEISSGWIEKLHLEVYSVCVSKHYYGDQIKESGAGRVRRTLETGRNAYRI
jgi:hypothetical protein